MQTKVNKGKYFTPLTIGVAAVWFSSHCGAGFASGTQEVAYFVRHGWLAPFWPLVAMTLVGLVMYVTLEIGRLHAVYTYSEIIQKSYVPIHRVLGTLYDVIQTISMVLAPAACLAGGAALFNQLFGWPTFVGTLVMLLLTVLVCIFGAKAVRLFGTALTIGMIIIVAIITFAGMAKYWDNIVYHISNRVVYTNYKDMVWYGILYGLFQSSIWAAGAASAVGMRYRNEAKGAVIVGIILNTFMLSAVVMMLMGAMPTVATDPDARLLPTLFVVQTLTVPGLAIIYQALLFMALITTAVGFVFAVQGRLGLLFLKNMKNVKLKNAIISTGWLIVIWMVSLFGLLAIIQKGYAAMGFINLVILVIPMFTLGIMNIKKYRRLEEQGELPPEIQSDQG